MTDTTTLQCVSWEINSESIVKSIESGWSDIACNPPKVQNEQQNFDGLRHNWQTWWSAYNEFVNEKKEPVMWVEYYWYLPELIQIVHVQYGWHYLGSNDVMATFHFTE